MFDHNNKLVSKMCYVSIEERICELELLAKGFNIRFIHLADSDFLLNPQRARMIVQRIKKCNLSCCFSINVSPQSVSLVSSHDIIEEFIKIGLVEILIGVEHFSAKVMLGLNKVFDLKNFKASLHYIKNSLHMPIVSFYTLVGLPGEYLDDIEINLAVLRECKNLGICDFTFPKFFVPYPGTDIFNEPNRYDVKITNYNWDEYHRWSMPRPIVINRMDDIFYLNEIKSIHKIFERFPDE